MDNDKLNRKLGQLGSLIGSKSKKSQSSPKSPPDRYRKFASKLQGELYSNFAGSFCIVRERYGRDYTHGTAELGKTDLRPVPEHAFEIDDSPGTIPFESMLFFDTETTGLGGAGTVPFLVGCGSIVDGSFEVRQYLVPDYPDETAMLEALQEELTPETYLVTYNGKSFDLPLVRDRFIINRVAREIPLAGHIDLVHACRRLFRRRLVDCKLTNIERELFAFHRNDDIPGYLIPSIYFDWLSEDRLDLLPEVLLHNRLDIVTLLFLTRHIADVFESEGESLYETDDLHSLARIYGRRRQDNEVARLYERIDEGAGLSDDALFYHAQSFKRMGDWSQAVGIWVRLADSESRQGYLACLELAKYHEHRTKDIGLALQYARQASRSVPTAISHREALQHRLNRLERKLAD